MTLRYSRWLKPEFDLIDEIRKVTIDCLHFQPDEWCLYDAEILRKASEMIESELNRSSRGGQPMSTDTYQPVNVKNWWVERVQELEAEKDRLLNNLAILEAERNKLKRESDLLKGTLLSIKNSASSAIREDKT